MDRFKYGWMLVAVLWLCTPAQAQEFTMEQAVEHALKGNPSVESKLLTLEQAKMNIGVAQSYFWPRVSLVSSNNRLENSGAAGSTDDLSSRSWSRGVRVNLSLFAGFAHLNNLDKSRLSVDMEEARHRQAKLELIANVQLQFLQLLKAREDLKSAKESITRIETQLKAAEAFVKVGMAPYVNVLQNQVELSKAKQQEIRVQNTIRNAEVQLNKYLNYSPDEPILYTGDLRDFSGVVSYTEEQAIKTALFSRPDLIMAQKSVAIAFKDMDITLGEYLPRVDATYDNMKYHKDYKEERYTDYSRSYWAVGLNVSWDVFTGGSTTFSYLGDKKRVEALQKDYEDAMSGAKTDVIRSLLDIKAAKDLINVSRKGVEAAKESYDMANKRYMTHTGTITELNDKGAVVSLGDNVEGFAPAKQLAKEDGTTAKAGETLEFKVVEFSKATKRIILSHSRLNEEIKRAEVQAERAEKKRSDDATKDSVKKLNASVEKTTLGDISGLAELKAQMEAAAEKPKKAAAKKSAKAEEASAETEE